MKSIQIPPSQEIQIFELYLLGTYFSLKLGMARSMLAKFHQIPSFQEFLVIFPLFQPIETFLIFYLNYSSNLRKFL
jgi:hypothetical protein